MKFIRSFKNKLYEGLSSSFKESEPYIFAYGIAVLIGVLGYYFLNKNVIAQNTYENFLLRLFSSVLVIPLFLNKYWPIKLNKLKMWYWYFVLMYTLPFFFSFMILMNPFSEVWHINGIICLVILVLFVDWLSFLFLLTLGTMAGVLLYALKKIDGGPFIPHNLVNVLIYSYLGPIIYIVLFSRKKIFLNKKNFRP